MKSMNYLYLINLFPKFDKRNPINIHFLNFVASIFKYYLIFCCPNNSSFLDFNQDCDGLALFKANP